jgi:hypothetical protein
MSDIEAPLATAEFRMGVHPPAASVIDGSVEVIELDIAEEETEHDLPIEMSELPPEVWASLRSQFPGAQLMDAEMSITDGTPVYEVNAQINDRALDVTLAVHGAILESAQALNSSELPEPVREWIGQNFPEAVIREAEMVNEAGVGSYQLVIETPGQPAFEATLRVAQAQSSPTTAVRVENFEDLAASLSNTAGPMGSANPHSVDAVSDMSRTAPASGMTQSGDSAARAGATQAVSSQKLDFPRATVPTSDGQPVNSAATYSLTLDSTGAVMGSRESPQTAPVVEDRPVTWIPHFAGILSDVLPIDATAVEQTLRQFLDELDMVADAVAGETDVIGAAARLATLAALIAGTQMIVLDSARARREPILVDSANASWNWVIGMPRPTRR